MKNILYLFIGLFYTSISAQVGINTTTPTETLDIEGTLRIRTLPFTGDTINTTNDGSAGTAIFKGNRNIVADVNGVVGYANNRSSDGVRFVIQPVGTRANPDFSDSKDVQSGCMKIKVDPTNILGVSGVYFYVKVDQSCLPTGQTSTFMAMQSREDSNITASSENHYWRGDISSTTWTFIDENINIITQDTPIQNFTFSFPDLGHVYRGVATANYGVDPDATENSNGQNWPIIAFYLDELY